jgi:hypothetical protein
VRKTITILLAAAGLAVAVAQPALADDPYARYYGSTDSAQTSRWCDTSWQYGVNGQWGAWGRYVDGCTASVQCPWSSCRVMQTMGQLKANLGTTKTCNMAVRIFNTAGALRYRADYSTKAYGDSACYLSRAAVNAGYGEWVTVQTNGVIGTSNNAYGQVRSYVWLAPA